MRTTSRDWLITGCSTGFGRSLAHLLIARGEQVFASARNVGQLTDLVHGHDNAHALTLHVTSPDHIRAAAAMVEGPENHPENHGVI